ncbi:Cyclin-dependent protein kinase inhibitor SMR13 [Senna tora]|uniref:Cyclin-dependent protein kinase inhibitor SMR13 n=1 Tax=Senna tora TaxID=362788 RepID=A0A834SKD9_9FABA|nr:Cyclin-dependent protein kinase inhibitor SMR13 [Senna tora]
MAPGCSRSRMKWPKNAQRKQEMNTIVEKDNNKEEEVDVVCSSSGCSTPKAKRFRIPELLTCPPAPKKRRKSQCISLIQFKFINRDQFALLGFVLVLARADEKL